ncbi:MAG: hypothetical protein IJU91_02875, partial [Selenomonadaceae bacterium]|nr:hypothetical protein [Selenomonadaceae bacterium]
MSKRYTTTTYYDYLKIYFEAQFIEPLTANEQAVMTHILNLCNLARNHYIKTSENRIVMASNLNKSSVHHALTTLTQKQFISVQPVGNQGTIIDLSPLNERFKNDEKSKAESDFSAPKKEEEKTREERQISNENEEKI